MSTTPETLHTGDVTSVNRGFAQRVLVDHGIERDSRFGERDDPLPTLVSVVIAGGGDGAPGGVYECLGSAYA
jgi:hypothetical protein